MKSKQKISSRSAYDDLGLKNHEEMETKANLIMEINHAIQKKGLTQTGTAKILGISQRKLSELSRERFRSYSVERLIHFINELDKDSEEAAGEILRLL